MCNLCCREYTKSLSQYYVMMIMHNLKIVKIDHFLGGEARSGEYKHRTIAKWLFYAPHVAKRPS